MSTSQQNTLNREEQDKEQPPLISVGVPVHNGENFIEKALDSILGQTYTNFELIICDNVSGDRTPDICKWYRDQDKRVTYHRNEKNIGPTNNFNRTFKLASGTYFKWAAHDDVIAEEFLARCLDVLEADPSVVVCSALTGSIDEEGELQHVWRHSMRTDSYKTHERFYDLLYHPHRQALYGLIRSSALRETSLLRGFNDSDGNLLVELALRGRLVELPELLFFDRVHPDKYTVSIKDAGPEARAAWFNPQSEPSPFRFPKWRGTYGYWWALWHAPLTKKERARCIADLLYWMGVRWRPLAGELKNNARRATQRYSGFLKRGDAVSQSST